MLRPRRSAEPFLSQRRTRLRSCEIPACQESPGAARMRSFSSGAPSRAPGSLSARTRQPRPSSETCPCRPASWCRCPADAETGRCQGRAARRGSRTDPAVRRSTLQAMTSSNFRRAASLCMASKAGRLSRPLEPKCPRRGRRPRYLPANSQICPRSPDPALCQFPCQRTAMHAGPSCCFRDIETSVRQRLMDTLPFQDLDRVRALGQRNAAVPLVTRKCSFDIVHVGWLRQMMTVRPATRT